MNSIADFLINGGQSQARLGNPKTISSRVQEWLGAKPTLEPNQAQQILAGRFQPEGADYGKAAVATLIGGQPIAGQDVADQRMSGYLDQLNTVKKLQANNGGTTGELIDRLMAENPDLSFGDALYSVQTGFRQGLMRDPVTGGIVPMSGVPEAKGAIKFGETSGGKQAELNYAGPIKGAERAVEANTAAEIERQKQIGQLTGEQEGSLLKRGVAAKNTLDLLDLAETYLPYASGGGLGALSAAGKSAVGYSDVATQADSQLDLIGSSLTASVPRFEGPQGVLDVQLYQKAAADVGNRQKPVGDRIAAIRTMRFLQQKYAGQEPDLSNALNPGMSLPGSREIPGLGGVTGNDINNGVIRVTTPEEAMTLPSGTKFMTPDGRTKVRP